MASLTGHGQTVAIQQPTSSVSCVMLSRPSGTGSAKHILLRRPLRTNVESNSSVTSSVYRFNPTRPLIWIAKPIQKSGPSTQPLVAPKDESSGEEKLLLVESQDEENKQNTQAHWINPPLSKTRKPRSLEKGLCSISAMFCQKLSAVGKTTYNKLVNELVQDVMYKKSLSLNRTLNSSEEFKMIDRNIRRRAYDTSNVLVAMGIVQKGKTTMHWKGFKKGQEPPCPDLRAQRQEKLARIEEKKKKLKKLLLEQVALRNLIEKNKAAQLRGQGAPDPKSVITLPFIALAISRKATSECTISEDKRKYNIKFDEPFNLHHSTDVLGYMGLCFDLEKGCFTPKNVSRAQALLDAPMKKYISPDCDADTYTDANSSGSADL